jgi:membrane associated rhomboid family serine protease
MINAYGRVRILAMRGLTEFQRHGEERCVFPHVPSSASLSRHNAIGTQRIAAGVDLVSALHEYRRGCRRSAFAMFVPLTDGVALQRVYRPIVTWALIAANILVFLLVNQSGMFNADLIAVGFGTIPSIVAGPDWVDADIAHVPGWLSLVTTQFLHADWFHLGANMLFLWVFGDNVEDAMGHVRFLIFYLACGVLAALAYVFIDTTSQAPLIGASGAISGVVAGYLVLYPRVGVFGLVFTIIPLRVTAIYILGAWLTLQLINAVFAADDGVAYIAHIGGAIAGLPLVWLLKDKDVPLFSGRTQ